MLYRPLKDGCIRILHLQGAGFDATISCTLKHVSLQQSDLPIYSTISYSWGSDIGATEILVDGENVNVPRNAAEALRRLRPQDSSARMLWIDSICIDQYNLGERSIQVAIMAEIYSHAAKNLIWLGEDDGTTQSALSNIDKLTSNIMAQTNDLATFPLGPGPNHHLHLNSGIDVEFDAQPIIRLLQRPWFSRLWVVQEATLAKVNVCHCGAYTFDLIPLLRVAKWLWTKRTHVRLHDNDNFREIRGVFAPAISLYDIVDQDLGWFHVALKQGWFDEKDVTSPLFSILDTTTLFQATQPVDHVFGILGLWLRFSPPGTTLPPLLRPDYTKSISGVFRDATRQAMIESQSLALWQNIQHRPDEEEPLFPTWVRRWNRTFEPLCDPTPFHRGVHAHAGWLNDTHDPAPNLPDSIVLSGIYIDESAEDSAIDVTSSIFSAPSFDPAFVTEVEALVHAHPHVRDKQPTDLDLNTALSTVLVAAESAERDVATPDDLHGLTDLKNYYFSNPSTPIPTLLQLTSCPTDTNVPPSLLRATRYAEAAWRMCHRRRFLITSSGQIGLGPQTMRSGDVVVIIYGCEWPVVLRHDWSRDESGREVEVWKIIGLAWVYGVMEGESVQRHVDVRGEGEDDGDVEFVII